MKVAGTVGSPPDAAATTETSDLVTSRDPDLLLDDPEDEVIDLPVRAPLEDEVTLDATSLLGLDDPEQDDELSALDDVDVDELTAPDELAAYAGAAALPSELADLLYNDDGSLDFGPPNAHLFSRRDEMRDRIKPLLDRQKRGELSAGEQTRLRRSLAELERTKEQLVELNFGLVLDYANKFIPRTAPENIPDFISAGRAGLIDAINRYDRSFGTPFSSLGHKYVKRQILKVFHRLEYSHLTYADFERQAKIRQARNELMMQDPTHAPTVEEIAAETGFKVEDVERILTASPAVSISTPVGDDSSGGELGDLLPDPTVNVEHTVLDAMTAEVLDRWGLAVLDERERAVLVRRFGLDGENPMCLQTIGETYGRSREAIRMIEARARSKLGHPVVLGQILFDGKG